MKLKLKRKHIRVIIEAIYRVIIKEGQKVNAYYIAKICLLGASVGFILTTTCDSLIIYIKDLKYFTWMWFKESCISLEKWLILAILSLLWPNCDTKRHTDGLFDIEELPYRYQFGHLIWQITFFGLYEFGGVIGEKIENLALRSDFEAVLDLIC